MFDIAQETNGRDEECADLRAIATPGAQAAIDDLMAALDLDAIIAPTNGPGVGHGSGQRRPRWRLLDVHRLVGAVRRRGLREVTVPAGFVGPLPVGVTFIGGRWSEPTLLGFAYDFEQATHARVPPRFIPTIGDDASASGQPRGRGKPQTIVPGRRGLWRMPPLR